MAISMHNRAEFKQELWGHRKAMVQIKQLEVLLSVDIETDFFPLKIKDPFLNTPV